MQTDETSRPRRSVLKGAGALGAILLAPKLPLWSEAEAAPKVSAPGDFIALSSVLLGVPVASLTPDPAQDNWLMADVLYNLEGVAGVNEPREAMIKAFNDLSPSLSDNEKARALLARDSGGLRPDSIGTFSRLTMLAWLFGAWYGDTETTTNPMAKNYIALTYRSDFIISGRAYKNGWIWRIAQAHPMGFSQFRFGSWASAPPTLKDYGIPTT